jgi:hypothetical protein
MKTKLILLVSLALLLVSFTVEASELVAARADTFVVGGTSTLMKIQTKVNAGAGALPSAYLLYAGDGAKFWLTRYDGATSAYGYDTPIPAGSSLTIPSPPPLRILDGNGEYRYYHYFFIGAAAVTDSVFIIPLDR